VFTIPVSVKRALKAYTEQIDPTLTSSLAEQVIRDDNGAGVPLKTHYLR
jgi:hypothetical protein